MKLEDGFSCAFIDLARLGRTDWRSVALTILLFKFLTILLSLIGAVLPYPGRGQDRRIWCGGGGRRHFRTLARMRKNFTTSVSVADLYGRDV